MTTTFAAALTLLLAASGCTELSRIDTCDPPALDEKQINALTSGDQLAPPARGLVRLPSGLFAAAWVSLSGPDDTGPGEIRAALFTRDGTIVRPCGSSVGDVAISADPTARVTGPAIAVGTEPDGPIYIAWDTTPAGASRSKILVRLMRQDLCSWSSTLTLAESIMQISDDAEDAHVPVVAARPDGREAVVVWMALPTGASATRQVRSRPVGITHNTSGIVEPNGCDGLEAPCTHQTYAFGGIPTLVALPTVTGPSASNGGYALAWATDRRDGLPGMDVALQILDYTARPLAMGYGLRSYHSALTANVDLAADGTTILVAHAAEPWSNAALASGPIEPTDSDLYLERFGLDAVSQGAPVRVASAGDSVFRLPEIVSLPGHGALLAWTRSSLDGTSRRALAVAVDEQSRPLFNGVSCDTGAFEVATEAGVDFSPSLATSDDGDAWAFFTSSTTVPGGTDSLGTSVHARRFELTRLVPSLR